MYGQKMFNCFYFNFVFTFQKTKDFLILAGNREWMNRHGISLTEEMEKMLTKEEDLCRTAVLCAVNGNTNIMVINFQVFIENTNIYFFCFCRSNLVHNFHSRSSQARSIVVCSCFEETWYVCDITYW